MNRFTIAAGLLLLWPLGAIVHAAVPEENAPGESKASNSQGRDSVRR